MLIWKNTKILDPYLKEFSITQDPKTAQIAVVGSQPIDLDAFSHLKGIFRAGIGQENLNLPEIEKRGIRVDFPSERSKDVLFEETANFTVQLIFRMLYSKVGVFDSWSKLERKALSKQKLLVVGLGQIGKRVYDKMKQFMVVDYFDIRDHEAKEFDQKIKTSDCITFHIPGGGACENFVTKKHFDLMQKDTVLINTARGSIVNENDLYEALIKQNIKAAAFDVFWKEPYSGVLSKLPENVFYKTPHVASSCNDFMESCALDLVHLINSLQ